MLSATTRRRSRPIASPVFGLTSNRDSAPLMEHRVRASIHREREGNLYVALCPELDVASQGASIESALDSLKEAVALFLETADPSEMKTGGGNTSS